MAACLRPSREIARALPGRLFKAAEGNLAPPAASPCKKQKKKAEKAKPKAAAMKDIEQKIAECRARRAEQLEQKKKKVRDLRKNRVQNVAVPATSPDPSIQKQKKVEKKVAAIQTEKKIAEGPKVAPKIEKSSDGSVKLGFKRGFFDKYEPLGRISKGGFGTVFKARILDGNQAAPLVAVKMMRKSKISERMAMGIKKEVEILAALNGGPNTVKFYDAFEDVEIIYIVMELLDGGDLHEMLDRSGVCDEMEAKSWIEHLLIALEALHTKRIAHRDLKPENIMFNSSGDLKLIDYGLSDYVAPGEKLSEMAGTPGYIAPEVFDKKGGIESDMWSVGVIAHLLLTGKYPFPDPINQSDINAWRPDMRNGPDFYDSAIWGSVSHEARDLIKRLLNPDPSLRMDVSQALDHTWFAHGQDHLRSNLPSASSLDRSPSCFF